MKYLIALSVLAAAAISFGCSPERPASGGERIGNSSTLPPDDYPGEDAAEPESGAAAPGGETDDTGDANGTGDANDTTDAGGASEDETAAPESDGTAEEAPE